MARFQMQQTLLSVGDDSWIEDDAGRRRYRVDGKALRVRDTVVLKDAADHEVATIQERKLRARGTMKIERDGRALATVHKAVVGIRDRFQIEVEGARTSRRTATSSTTRTRWSATATWSRPSRSAGCACGTRMG